MEWSGDWCERLERETPSSPANGLSPAMQSRTSPKTDALHHWTETRQVIGTACTNASGTVEGCGASGVPATVDLVRARSHTRLTQEPALDSSHATGARGTWRAIHKCAAELGREIAAISGQSGASTKSFLGRTREGGQRRVGQRSIPPSAPTPLRGRSLARCSQPFRIPLFRALYSTRRVLSFLSFHDA